MRKIALLIGLVVALTLTACGGERRGDSRGHQWAWRHSRAQHGWQSCPRAQSGGSGAHSGGVRRLRPEHQWYCLRSGCSAADRQL